MCHVLAVLITVVSLAWTADLPRAVGLVLFPPQFLARDTTGM